MPTVKIFSIDNTSEGFDGNVKPNRRRFAIWRSFTNHVLRLTHYHFFIVFYLFSFLLSLSFILDCILGIYSLLFSFYSSNLFFLFLPSLLPFSVLPSFSALSLLSLRLCPQTPSQSGVLPPATIALPLHFAKGAT